jgi:hypothetical protein
VGNIDDHAQTIHLPDHLPAEIGKATVPGRIR